MNSANRRAGAGKPAAETTRRPGCSKPADGRGSALLIVISAPSGGGKTTLCDGLLKARPGITRAITCTTRAPRGTERDGEDYYFLSAPEFESRVRAGEFLEHATVFGNRYGTLKSEALDKLRLGRDVLLAVDVQGAATLRREAGADAKLKQALVTIFLTPPSFDILEQRLRKRATDDPVSIQNRLAAARLELSQWKSFDYLVISASIEEDLRRALEVIEAEKMRASRAVAPVF